MTRLHFDDLTAITAPFGLLDDDTRQRLHAWPHGWEFVTARGEWAVCYNPQFFRDYAYRARPAPLEPDYVDWSHVAEPFNWHARDENGYRFFYKAKPELGDGIWLDDLADNDMCEAAAVAGFVRGTVDWRDSLISRPGVEG